MLYIPCSTSVCTLHDGLASGSRLVARLITIHAYLYILYENSNGVKDFITYTRSMWSQDSRDTEQLVSKLFLEKTATFGESNTY